MPNINSYHTYIFPFVWEGSKHDSKDLDDFISNFSENPAWKDVTINNQFDISDSDMSNEEVQNYYKEYQFFYPHVRKAIYGFDRNIVRIFSFRPDVLKKQSSNYVIEKNNYRFVLNLTSIKLKIYNTGVALFIIECNNDKYKKIEEIMMINDYGRRITVPFISSEYGITADKLTISVDGVKDFVSDFKGFSKEAEKEKNLKNTISLTHIADSIIELLNYNSNYKISSRCSDDKNVFYIYPALDDRMYVSCYIIDEEKAKEYCLHYPFDDNNSLHLHRDCQYYSLAYVDASYCTCQNLEMRIELIKKATYTRWTDYNSIYTIVNMGMMCVTNSCESYLRFNFTELYVKFAELCLVQCASIKNFQRQVSNLSANVEQKDKTIKKTLKKLTDLQERVVAFESQLHFTEVSSEEQAIEMYRMVYDAARIDCELEQLKSQLGGLYESATTSIESSINRLGWVFTIYGIIIGIFTHMARFEDKAFYFNADEMHPLYFIWIIAPIVILIVVLIQNTIIYGRRWK